MISTQTIQCLELTTVAAILVAEVISVIYQIKQYNKDSK